ncbi:MAG: sulfurtransferase [Alphaproteobacteria bacterium]
MSDSALVSTRWLADRLATTAQERLVVIDGTWHMPDAGRDADAEYLAAHIPAALRIDFGRLRDTHSPLPLTLPSPDAFSAHVGQLGIGQDHTLVIYDSNGLFSAPRLWWMFRVMGHERVHVLDGGMTAWQAEGRPVESGPPPARRPVPYAARFRPELLRTLEQMRHCQAAGSEQIADGRGAASFNGQSKGGGHIPGSYSLPWSTLVDAATGTLLPADTLAQRLRDAGVDPARPLVTTCGGGVVACTVALALHELGLRTVPVYDGSWNEWGSLPDTPKAAVPDLRSEP